MASPTVLCLFDVDGTLTAPRAEFLARLRKKVTIGVVGGSDFVKINEQLGGSVTTAFDFTFGENGLTAFKGTESLETQSFLQFLGEENLARLVNFCMHYIANLEIPRKRGTFIEFRNGMINVSPIGRNCSREERNEFNEYDKIHHVRRDMVTALQEQFADYGLKFSIGGQISFDIFPIGWDKTYCLRHIQAAGNFETIHFFGDKTEEGGNDHEIFEHPDTIGHAVKTPDDTRAILSKLFGLE